MSDRAFLQDDLKERIIADPDVVLEDREVMRALIAANESALGPNIVDLRGIALDRLESRLDQLEDTHRSVIAAAYENLAGTNQVHRAVLALLEPNSFEGFLTSLSGDVAEILRVDHARLVLETHEDTAALTGLGPVLVMRPAGTVDAYMARGRGSSVRNAILRQVRPENEDIYGSDAEWVRSEACLRLDLGQGRLPGMLVFASEDPHQFKPTQGTDLLLFLAGAFERCLKRWLG